ncbi:hypothetical protein [Georgenia sp. Z1491]|uniref:hypothetical protein n=1 Tax=Georgenia sp. Z1491 TaxID=3416707 RepID=UPI003CF3183D
MLVPSAVSSAPEGGDDAPAPTATVQYLTVSTLVSTSELTPGEPFSDTIVMGCDKAACVDAQLVDQLPAELAGLPITDAAISPGEASIPRAVTWREGGSDLPCGAVGMVEGQNFTIVLSLQVPVDLAPGTDITALATGVSEADVAGLRLTCTGEIEPGASAGITLDVEQRATERDTSAGPVVELTLADTQTSAAFTIGTTDEAAGSATSSITVNNTMTTTVTAANGRTAEAGAGDTLVVIAPGIEVTLPRTSDPAGPSSRATGSSPAFRRAPPAHRTSPRPPASARQPTEATSAAPASRTPSSTARTTGSCGRSTPAPGASTSS